jgi:hypothetical protein
VPCTQWVRHHLSSNHLFSAHLFAQNASQIEEAGNPTDDQHLQHRGFVTASIMSSVAFVEAAINELYVVCAEHPDDIHVNGHPQDERFGGIGADAIQMLGALWQVESFQRSANVLDKCQTALRLAKRAEFDKGANPYQDAKLVIDLRNLLVHFKPEEREIAVGAGNRLPSDAFESRYRTKFPENAIAAKYAIFGTPTGPLEADYPFFPEKCLGSGCAYWAFRSALTYINEMFRRLGTTWYHHWLFDKGMIPRSAT